MLNGWKTLWVSSRLIRGFTSPHLVISDSVSFTLIMIILSPDISVSARLWHYFAESILGQKFVLWLLTIVNLVPLVLGIRPSIINLMVFSNNSLSHHIRGILSPWILLNIFWPLKGYFYLGSCRSLHQAKHFHPHIWHYHFHSIGWTFCCPCIFQAWCSISCYVWLWLLVCLSLLQITQKSFGYETPFHLQISSRRRWSNQTC